MRDLGIRDEVAVEASIPVQTRADIRDLAELALLWEANGYRLKSMSQLISFSLHLLCQEIRAAGKMPHPVESVREAHQVMVSRALYQGSMMHRTQKKISMAMGFENLREEGIDPRGYAPGAYKTMHNTHSIEPPPEMARGSVYAKPADPDGSNLTDEDREALLRDLTPEIRAKLERQRAMYLENERRKSEVLKQEEEERKRVTEKALRDAIDSGMVVDDRGRVMKPGEGFKEGTSPEELAEYDRAREAEILKRENTPVDEEWMRKNVVIDHSKIGQTNKKE